MKIGFWQRSLKGDHNVNEIIALALIGQRVVNERGD